VEVVPSILSDKSLVSSIYKLMKDWGKTPVIAKDTPGFIVNKVARPFYGEALRIYEENIADFASIDSALKTIGGFRMGPFELMDLIGNDINYKVTETVFTEFYFDGRYMPSITQKRYSEAGLLGRKSGRGFYDYSNNTEKHISNIDEKTSQYIFNRVLVMLINEAVDTLFRGIASREDIDLAVTKGVNYPKGLLKWADEIGIDNIYNQLKSLYDIYLEDRYRPCPLLLSMAQSGSKFYQESE
jgi:3-hydroxybutyryl-CoA dehydrogenase